MAVEHGFFGELRRRHVWRVAVAYAAVGWLVVQVATQVFPAFHMPDWTEQIVVILVVIGFPIIVALAWVYEITPEGLRRTEPAGSPEARPEHQSRQIVRKLNTVIVAVLVVAVALMGWRMMLAQRHGEVSPGRSPDVAQRNPGQTVPDAAASAAASGLHAVPAEFNPPAASIVVLPFVNLNGDPKQAYFSDGITEELTNALGQNTGLTVIAWDTASKYAHSKLTPKEIGKALNVAQVLAGSIQREGEAVRVTTELINTTDGRQLWSAHYDESLKNIFAVQDKVSAAIADALQVKFAGMQASPTLNPEAHDLYLKGLTASNRWTTPDAQAALRYFQQAVKLDPNYADAWAGAARVYYQLSEISTLPLKEALPKIRAAASKALALDPHNVSALLELGNADYADHRIAEAKAEYERALALDPSNAAVHTKYATVLPLKQALAQNQVALRLDPEDAVAQNNIAAQYADLGDWPHALGAILATIRLAPHSVDAAFGAAFVYTRMQRGEDAVKVFDLVQPTNAADRQLVDAGRLTFQALLQPDLRPKALAALEGLHSANPDPTSQGDLIQLYLALGKRETALRMLIDFCAAIPIACSDLAVNPTWAPLHGDPRFEKLAKQYTTMTLGSAPASASSR